MNCAIMLTNYISPSDISAILEYLFQLTLVYISCFIGAALRDFITASKANTKAKIGSSFLYSIPCAFIMATAYDFISKKLGFGALVLACVFVGMWSREVTSLLLNNRVALAIAKIVASGVIKSAASMSDKEKEELATVFEDAVKEGKKSASGEEDNDSGALTKDEEPKCITANDSTPKDTTPEEPGKEEENKEPEEPKIQEPAEDTEDENDTTTQEKDNAEDELSGNPVGEFDWTDIIGY